MKTHIINNLSVKRNLNILLISAIVITLALVAVQAYASSGTDIAAIDTEVCIDCGACYEAQTIWLVEDSENGYPYWVHGEGGFEGLLFYNNPTETHKQHIEEELMGVCPNNVFIINWK
jgi:ferredoxin-like protein FixX